MMKKTRPSSLSDRTRWLGSAAERRIRWKPASNGAVPRPPIAQRDRGERAARRVVAVDVDVGVEVAGQQGAAASRTRASRRRG